VYLLRQQVGVIQLEVESLCTRDEGVGGAFTHTRAVDLSLLLAHEVHVLPKNGRESESCGATAGDAPKHDWAVSWHIQEAGRPLTNRVSVSSSAGWRAAERHHTTGRERMGTPTLQALQDPILLLPWV
jgi:hypothetical protein